MKFLNGWKTILGVIGTLTTIAVSAGVQDHGLIETVKAIAGHADSLIVGATGILTVIGVIHKSEKRQHAKETADVRKHLDEMRTRSGG